MGAAPACTRTRRVYVAATAVIAVLGLICTGAAATSESDVWGIELEGHKTLSATDLVRFRRQGLNTVVVDPARVKPAQRQRLVRLARRAGMAVAVPRSAATPTLVSLCRAERRGPARSCTLLARSPKAAVALARRNVADFVVLRVSKLSQIRFLRGVKAKTHIVAVARTSASKLDRAAWARAIATAATDPTLDLAVNVRSASQPSLPSYLALVRTARGAGKRTSSADTTPPNAPAAVVVEAVSPTSVSLRWASANADQNVAGYGVYRSGVLVDTVAEPRIDLAGLACGTSYTFSIDAFDVAQNRSQPTSTIASTSACAGGGGGGSGGGDGQAPSAPSGLSSSTSSQTSITIAWSPSADNVGVSGYGVYRNGSLVASTALLNSTVPGLACGTTYSLAVDAVDGAGNRSAQANVTASTRTCAAGADTTAPTVPTSLTETARSQTSISVSWTASTDGVGVAGYGAYRAGTLQMSVTATSATFSGLACGSSYGLAVDAFDVAGNRSGKASLSGATAACSSPPPPPASGSANVWVDTNGGSCARQASAGAYVDASACGSFDAAFDRASPGDAVNIAGGTYPGQALSGDKGSSSPVVVRVAPGQSVVVNGDLDITGDYVQVFGPITVNRIDIDDGNQSNPILGVLVSGLKAKSSFIENAHDLTIKDSEFGPNLGQILIQIGGAPETHRLTLDNVYLHDNGPTSADQHLECIFSTGIQGLTIRNSRFQNCGYFGLLSGMCCGATREPSSFVFENNHFGRSKCYPGAGGCPSNGDAPYSMMLSRPVSGQSRIVGNHFETPPALTGSFQQLTATGNTGAAPTTWR